MQLSVSRRGYKEFVREGVGEGHREDFYQGREDTRVLGDDQFVEGVLGRSAEKSASRPSLDKLVKTVCEAYSVTDRQLCDPSRNRKAAEVRSVIGYLATQTECAALTEVARRFGRDVATLSKGDRRTAPGSHGLPRAPTTTTARTDLDRGARATPPRDTGVPAALPGSAPRPFGGPVAGGRRRELVASAAQSPHRVAQVRHQRRSVPFHSAY